MGSGPQLSAGDFQFHLALFCTGDIGQPGFPPYQDQDRYLPPCRVGLQGQGFPVGARKLPGSVKGHPEGIFGRQDLPTQTIGKGNPHEGLVAAVGPEGRTVTGQHHVDRGSGFYLPHMGKSRRLLFFMVTSRHDGHDHQP